MPVLGKLPAQAALGAARNCVLLPDPNFGHGVSGPVLRFCHKVLAVAIDCTCIDTVKQACLSPSLSLTEIYELMIIMSIS